MIDHVNAAEQSIEQQSSSAVASIGNGVYCSINMLAQDFNAYLCDLYEFAGQEVKDLKADAMMTVRRYDCLSKAYVGHYGHSYEIDYDAHCFDHASLDHWSGYIKSIHGKIIYAIDPHGHGHYLQIAPCTHFEGQFALPMVGHKIFWKGAKQHCGKTYVKWATTCNC